MNKNYNTIKAKYPMLREKYQAIEEKEPIQEDIKVYIDTAMDGTDIVTFEIDGAYRYVNSRYEPLKQAKIWAEQFEGINPQAIVILFGLGNGIHVREMLKVLGKTNYVFIVEPNPAMFQMVMNEFDIADIISDSRTFIEVKGVSDGVYNESLNTLLHFGNFQLVQCCALPNYDRVYPQGYLEVYNQYKAAAELLVLDRNTQIRFSDEFIKNMLHNYADVVRQRTINDLKEQFSHYDLTDIPAIIVSAGPSLDKNIHELKAAEGKCLLLVVDTALKPTLNAGIVPDLSVIVDPHKPMILFAHDKIKEVPMVSSYAANYRVLEKQEAPRFYFGNTAQYINYIYSKYADMEVDKLDTGGSVAHNAFSLAHYLGFKTIILVGQDLAFSGNQSHASSAYSAKVDRDLMLQASESCMVEDIHGNMVETMKNMELYLRWFEKQISIHPELKVIDATEGGAKKKGTIIMTLKDAIASECKKEFPAKTVIAQVEPTFAPDVLPQIYEEFRQIPNQIEMLKKKMEEGIRDYYRFGELYRKGKNATAEFKRIVDKITKINTMMDDEPLSELINTYSAKDNFEVVEDIFAYKDNEQEEINTIISKGVRMLTSYKKAADQLKEDLGILLQALS